MSSAKKSNLSLNKANKAKNDEFYTQLSDIEKELSHYQKHLKNKVIYCNCDDPKESNFFKYFALNFKFLGLKKLISTHYNKGEKSYKLEVVEDINSDGIINLDDAVKTNLKGDGDFRSDECIEILKEADIVVTNPPFSLFREHVSQIVKLNKKFIVIGNQNAITYKEIFPLIKNNLLWIGNTYPKEFIQPNGTFKKFGNICWFTNIIIEKRYKDIEIVEHFYEEKYSKYDNYDAIEVSRVEKIPLNYNKIMGVPITFMNKYNPNQFEIIGATESEGKGFSNGIWDESSNVAQPLINNKRKYKRIFIRHKKTKSICPEVQNVSS